MRTIHRIHEMNLLNSKVFIDLLRILVVDKLSNQNITKIKESNQELLMLSFKEELKELRNIIAADKKMVMALAAGEITIPHAVLSPACITMLMMTDPKYRDVVISNSGGVNPPPEFTCIYYIA